MIKKILTTAITIATLTGCQTLPKTQPSPIQIIDAPIKFSISGKIGITSTSPKNSQSGTAFYAWTQDGERFAIDLTGAFGFGATSITFNGKTATLVSERTGQINASSPEELLLQATGWQAPISQLPYWIMGRTAPSDDNYTYDDTGRLLSASNGEWTAIFEYKNNTPNRLHITHTGGYRIVMTIVHVQ